MPAPDIFSTKSAAFLEWLKSNGANISNKIEIHDYRQNNQGRGIRAVADIQEDEVIFSLPRSIVISEDNDPGRFSQLLEKNGNPDLSAWSSLIAILLLNSNSDQWKPYLDVLPQSFDSLMFWNDQELDNLKGSYVVDRIGKKEAEDEYYQVIQPLFEGVSDVDSSLEAFHRMGSLIMAYSFDIPPKETADKETGDDEYETDNEDDFVKAMVPLADTLNAHTKYCNARLSPTEDGSLLEMRAIKNIASGEQVYNSYGELPNSDLLRRYGYYEPGGNDFDVVEIKSSNLLAALKSQNDLKISQDIIDKCMQFAQKLEDEEDIVLLDPESFDIPVSGQLDSETLTILLLFQLASQLPEVKPKHIFKFINNTLDSGKPVLTPEIKTTWKSILHQRAQEYDNPSGTSSRAQFAHDIINREKEILSNSLDWIDSAPECHISDLVELLASKKRSASGSETVAKRSRN